MFSWPLGNSQALKWPVGNVDFWVLELAKLPIWDLPTFWERPFWKQTPSRTRTSRMPPTTHLRSPTTLARSRQLLSLRQALVPRLLVPAPQLSGAPLPRILPSLRYPSDWLPLLVAGTAHFSRARTTALWPAVDGVRSSPRRVTATATWDATWMVTILSSGSRVLVVGSARSATGFSPPDIVVDAHRAGLRTLTLCLVRSPVGRFPMTCSLLIRFSRLASVFVPRSPAVHATFVHHRLWTLLRCVDHQFYHQWDV